MTTSGIDEGGWFCAPDGKYSWYNMRRVAPGWPVNGNGKKYDCCQVPGKPGGELAGEAAAGRLRLTALEPRVLRFGMTAETDLAAWVRRTGVVRTAWVNRLLNSLRPCAC